MLTGRGGDSGSVWLGGKEGDICRGVGWGVRELRRVGKVGIMGFKSN